MTEWVKVGVDLGTGAAAGVGDQLIQNWDERRALAARTAGTLAADKKLPIMKQAGTYLNFGVPILGVVGVATNFVKGDWATRLVTIGGQLAGRKVTHQLTTGAGSSTPTAAYTKWERAKAAQEAAKAGGGAGMRASVLEI